ncbi:ribonuclease Oy [Danaus plexippus]|uniref:ribonuclease Oy n=1 Tax=Danaus plexippus TaxID=13037 RepID=UPI002AB1B0EF|nr:ribonuclease Oy [Danaus plexippus]
MSELKAIFILFTTFIIHFAVPTVNAGSDFDLLIFTQQWPATACKEWKKHNPSHTCSMPKNSETWTIHGIWPTKMGMIGPAFCNRTWFFDPEKIRPIEEELLQKWPNIYGGTSEYALWSHEWAKHGTCAAILKPLNSELNYFQNGLEFLKTFTMTDILEKNSIVPSNTEKYTVADIHDAIKQRVNKNPVIECKVEEGGDNYISEIRICFTKELQLTDCDGVVTQKYGYGGILTNCHSTRGIIYPQYKKYIWYVELYKLLTWLQWFTL